MNGFLPKVDEALLMSAGMFWSVAWSLVLGFVLSGLIQAIVSQDRMRKALGNDGIREIALATALGAASSSCSYASASVMRTLFKRGAAFVPSLAFLFSSTNLVLELGLVLYVLMGWQFTAAEWIGGLVLVAIMAILVRLTYPKALIEAARRHAEPSGGHDHSAVAVKGQTLWQKLANPRTRILVAQNVAMDVSMLWKDLLGGFVIAGFLSAFVPATWWAALFLKGDSPWLQVPANVVIGPVVAVLSFVCSIGNVPMAAILWGSGITFGGVLAFLYADLIVLPLLDVYRRYYGWRMATYIGGIFFVTMVVSALLMDLVFTALGLVPLVYPNMRAQVTHFSFNYTFWLNLVFGGAATSLAVTNWRHPKEMHRHGGSQPAAEGHHH